MSQHIQLSGEIPEAMAGSRADRALARLFPDYSRSRIQAWIKAGQVRLDGQPLRARDTVQGGEQVAIEAELAVETEAQPQAIPLTIVYEDEHLIVVDKPPDLVVHPAAGNPDGTLQNALLHRYPELATLPRAGLVHRLDKDTSGLMVVARSLQAHHSLVAQLQDRTVGREYLALVQGRVIAGATVDAPIGRHPVDRKRMAVVERGRPAVTRYRIEERLPAHTLVRVSLDTGRTHQIRVHMAHIGFPLVGDPVYGGRLKRPPGISDATADALRAFRRQALHAARLGLVHPASGLPMRWTSAMPEDLQGLLAQLREEAAREA